MAAIDLQHSFERALSHHERGDTAQAEVIYRQILAIDPDHADSLHLLGLIGFQQGETAFAVACMTRAVEINPDAAPYHNNLANCYRQQGRLDAAESALREAVRLRPASAEIWSNLGNVLRDRDDLAGAIACYREATNIRPDSAESHYNLANALAETGVLGEAEAHYQQALTLRPNYADAHYNLGNAFIGGGQHEAAAACFRTVIGLQPAHHGAYNNLGIALQEQGRLDEAARSYRDALAHKQDYAEAWFNLGCVRMTAGANQEALDCYRKAVAFSPDYAEAHIALCIAELPILYREESEIPACRAAYEQALGRLTASANPRNTPAFADAIGTSQPFFLAYQGQCDRPLQTIYGQWASQVMADAFPPVTLPPAPARGEKIRLGIVSGFFHDHTVWKLFLEGWLRHIDRGRFEIFAYYTGAKQDDRTSRAKHLADRFVQGLARKDWRGAILDDKPHVLLYPDIGMDAMSARLAAQRLAPVQCMTWGHPETSGFTSMDYFLSNALMEPPEAEAHYTEKLVLLPNLSTWYKPDPVQAVSADRARFGYRPNATVYWSGQAIYKYLPQYDEIFPRIAAAVEDSQFVFIDFAKSRAVTDIFKQRLNDAFARHGLEMAHHCVFLPSLDQAHFLAAMNAADIVLDTIGWSGGRSTLDILDRDPAIVTYLGPLMRGRHTAAILARIGITETIAASLDEYAAIAIRLAKEPVWRQFLKDRVRRGKSLVYEDGEYIRGLEEFLVEAVRT